MSVKGVTGDKSISTSNIRNSLELVRNGTRLPIGLGFGIKTPEVLGRLLNYRMLS